VVGVSYCQGDKGRNERTKREKKEQVYLLKVWANGLGYTSDWEEDQMIKLPIRTSASG